MSLTDELLRLPFDLYERYSTVQRILPFFTPDDRACSVLDVGGNSPLLWPGFTSLIDAFAPESFAITVDPSITPGLKHAVQASGFQLPFQDESFDLVCSLDALEHIRQENRHAVLSEMVRISRHGVFLAFPQASEVNARSEAIVEAYLTDVLASPIPQLREHAHNGLPAPDFVADFFSQTRYPFISFGHGNIDVWLLMMLTFHTLRVQSSEMAMELNRRFNSEIASQDWRTPAYRACFLLSKQNDLAWLETLKKNLVSSENWDDHHGILSFCQLYLQISHMGKVVVDKDRHIRNLDSILSTLTFEIEQRDQRISTLQRKLESANSFWQQNQVEHYQTRIRDLEQQIARISIACTRVGMQLEEQIRTVGLIAEQLAEKDQRIRKLEVENSEYAARIIHVVESYDAKHRATVSKLSTYEARLSKMERTVHDILNSRIWQTLCALGGAVLKLNPARRRIQKPTVRERSDAGITGTQSQSLNSTDERCILFCDEPTTQENQPRSGTIRVRGWALSPYGVEGVDVEVAGCDVSQAATGIPRPDVKKRYPNLDVTGKAGFLYEFDSAYLPNGRRTIVVRLRSNGRVVQELSTSVVIDHDQAPASDYDQWICQFETHNNELLRIKMPMFEYRPLVSILMPVYNTSEKQLEAAVHSVLNQTYPEWELCIADDHSTKPEIRKFLEKTMSNDLRIRVAWCERNGGISAASNSALDLASGEFVALLDHDDELAPNALAWIVDALQTNPAADVLYSDEDKIDVAGKRRFDPFFKPRWSPDLLLSENYICHILVLRRSLIQRLNGFRSEFDGAQDYDLILRATEQTSSIVHVPHILYHWRAGDTSSAASPTCKDYTTPAARRALEAALDRRLLSAHVEPAAAPGRWRVRYAIAGTPRVSIIIASGGNTDILRANLTALATRTDYPHREILVIDNSNHENVERLLDNWNRSGKCIARYIDWRNRPFNYSAINNRAARACESPILLFLNDDTSANSADWLTAMVELITRQEVGAVGAKLLYPDGRIQHAGVVMGLFDNCGHAFKGMDGHSQHYFDFPDVIRNVSAVTGACLMTRRDVFWQAGGFDEEKFAVAFNDIDLCLKIGSLGYRVLYTPYALLYHHEAFSKTAHDLIPHPAEVEAMRLKWQAVIDDDPFYSPNLTRNDENYRIRTYLNN